MEVQIWTSRTKRNLKQRVRARAKSYTSLLKSRQTPVERRARVLRRNPAPRRRERSSGRSRARLTPKTVIRSFNHQRNARCRLDSLRQKALPKLKSGRVKIRPRKLQRSPRGGAVLPRAQARTKAQIVLRKKRK